MNYEDFGSPYHCKLCKVCANRISSTVEHTRTFHEELVETSFLTFKNYKNYSKWFQIETRDKFFKFVQKRGSSKYKGNVYNYLTCHQGVHTKHKCFAYINTKKEKNREIKVNCCLYHTHLGNPGVYNLLVKKNTKL